MLGVFFGMILVEQRHDRTHHGVIEARFTPLVGELPDLEQLEVIAEEPPAGMDHHDIEGRGLGRARLDHLLERRPAILGGGGARFDEGFNPLLAAREASGLARPRRGNAKVQGGAKGNAGCHQAALNAFWTALGLRSMTSR